MARKIILHNYYPAKHRTRDDSKELRVLKQKLKDLENDLGQARRATGVDKYVAKLEKEIEAVEAHIEHFEHDEN